MIVFGQGRCPHCRKSVSGEWTDFGGIRVILRKKTSPLKDRDGGWIQYKKKIGKRHGS